MSLDDESPTQYFGADAEVWLRPDGRTIQLAPATAAAYRDTRAFTGWVLTDQKPLVFGPHVVIDQDGPRIERDPLPSPGTLGKPLTTEGDILAEIDAMRADLTMEDAAAISAAGRNPDALPHRTPGTADEEYVRDLARMLEIHARTIAVQNELIRELQSLLKSSRKGYWFAAGFASICAAAAGTLAAQTGVL